MKRFLTLFSMLAVTALLCLSGTAHADGLDLATKNTKNFQTFTGAPASGDVEPVFDASDDKWKTRPVGQVIQAQVASTTTTATLAQCGSTFVNDSADVITLPEASTALGCRYTFVCGNASNFDINPNDGTDQIGLVFSITGTNTTTAITPSAGDAIRCAAVGASITLEAVGANLWVSVGNANGTWTDVN